MTAAVIPTAELPAILQRISAGEYMAHIAQEYGCSKQALSQRLRQIPEYASAREVGMEIRLDDGLQRISRAAKCQTSDGEVAAIDLDLVRACEAELRRLEWRAEREFPHRWGARTQVTMEVGPDLGELLRESRQRLAQTQQPALQQSPVIDVSDAQQVDEQE